MAPLGVGSRVGDYEISAEIGRGGMGVVYRAHHSRLDRDVALKVIAPDLAQDPTFRGRFDRESRLAAAIEHPHAVPVYEAGESDGVVFIAMRLVEGTDLRALLREKDWLEPEHASLLVDQVGGALDAAHGLGLIHRDVKPANVLIGKAGKREWAYLTDFGLTKHATDATELTESGKWMGTADYASPEQIQGEKLDARSDVYSLGCVLYESLTGRIPFERESPVAKLWAHVNDPPPTVSEALPEPSPAMDAVVARALAKKPSDRFPSAGDLGRAALAASRGDQATVPERSVAKGEAAPGGTAALTRPLKAIGRDGRAGRPGWVPAAAGVGALLVIALIGWGLLSLLGGGDGDGSESGGGSGEGAITVGEDPLSVTLGEGFAWVTNEGAGTVSRIDAKTREVVGDPIEVGEAPSNIRYGAGSVWVANAGSDTVSRIDPKAARVEDTITVGHRPTGMRVVGQSVWVSNTEDDTVMRIDPESGRVAQTVPVGSRPAGIAIDQGIVFVVNSGDDTISRFSAKTGRDVGEPLRSGGRPRGIVADFGSIWVTSAGEDAVSRINTTTGELEATIAVGADPAQIQHSAPLLWVANEGSDSVSKINPTNNRSIGEVPVGDAPRGIAAGDGLVWVVNSGDDSVSVIEP